MSRRITRQSHSASSGTIHRVILSRNKLLYFPTPTTKKEAHDLAGQLEFWRWCPPQRETLLKLIHWVIWKAIRLDQHPDQKMAFKNVYALI